MLFTVLPAAANMLTTAMSPATWRRQLNSLGKAVGKESLLPYSFAKVGGPVMEGKPAMAAKLKTLE